MKQREIKFRAWNKIWKMMSMVDKIEFEDGNPYSVSTTIEATDFDHTDEWSDYEVGDEIILQQFTGLKDKNGKEIYEGDIVKIHNYKQIWKHQEPPIDWKIFEIKWNRYLWQFNNHYISKPLSDYDTNDLMPYDIEIIGNIYENPELLNTN